MNKHQQLYNIYKYKPWDYFLKVLLKYSCTKITERIPLNVLRLFFSVRKRILPGLSDANPLKLINVDPSRINYYHIGNPRRLGGVVGGSWDQNLRSFREHPIHEALIERYRKDLPWEETSIYRTYLEQIEQGHPYWKCPSREHLNEYLKSIDSLYESIATEGYKTQRELLNIEPDKTRRRNNDFLHPALNEITVNITRNGTFVKRSAGNHRLSIAKLLELDKVPILVQVRHVKWQTIRENVLSTDAPEELSNRIRSMLKHPDLADIVPSNWIN